MSKYGLLFNGELKKYTGKKIHLDVRPDAKPVHQRAFLLPKSQEELFKKELHHLVHYMTVHMQVGFCKKNGLNPSRRAVVIKIINGKYLILISFHWE